MASRRVLCATLCIGLSLGWAVPALAQGAQCNTSENIVRIQTRGPIGMPDGIGHGLTAPLQVIGYNSANKPFDITNCVTWEEPTPDIVTRIHGGPTGSLLQSGAPTDILTGQIHVGRLEAVFKNNEGKVLRAYKLVSVSLSGGLSARVDPTPFRQFLVKAPPLPVAPLLPVAAPPPIQPASGGSGIADAGIDPLFLGLGVAGAVGLAAIAFSGLDFGPSSGGSSCPSNPCLSVIVSSCSCFPCGIVSYVSCSGGGGGSDCKQCGN